MAENVRIRINLAAGELELEGPERFVEAHQESLQKMMALLVESRPVSTPALSRGDPTTRSPQHEVPFGELFNQLSTSAKDVDKILLAGFYAQRNSKDRVFTTRKASSLLAEVGVKLTNPSQSLKQNERAKRLFRHREAYRVSKEGEEHIANLLSSRDHQEEVEEDTVVVRKEV